MDSELVEQRRNVFQKRLDATKTSSERNKLGQFATPFPLALEILSCAARLVTKNISIRFLDPAFGTGAFYSALTQIFPQTHISAAVGYEIDPHYGKIAQSLWQDTLLDIRIADFTKAPMPTNEEERFNLVICNPPYVRHHHFSTEDKTRLKGLVKQRVGIEPNGLSGLYCYFLWLTHISMSHNGLAGWLIPSEFMDVNYGKQVKAYLLNNVTLLRVHRFDPEDVQFADALVSSTIVWFRKALPPLDHQVEVTFGGTLNNPKVTEKLSINRLRHETKWSRLLDKQHQPDLSRKLVKLSDLFEIKRGVATGANDFFILTPDEVEIYDLPKQFLTPILPSPRYLTSDEILANPDGEPRIDKRLYLLSCNLSPARIEHEFPSLWCYLKKGVDQGVDQGYLCRHRSLWYLQEQRLPAPILCTYMGRNKNENRMPIRFIFNHSSAIAPNIYLNLYPKPSIINLLAEHPDLQRSIWECLRATPIEKVIGEGRVYGGGLHKIEPKELGNLQVQSIADVLAQTMSGIML